MARQRKLYIDGKWVEGETTTVVRAPWDGEELAELSLAGEAQLEGALQSAAAAAERGAKAPTHERARWLDGIAAGLRARREEMAETIRDEAGKPITLALGETDRAISTFDLAARLTMTHEHEAYPLDIIATGEGRQCITRRFPIGPVLGITPWNWPLNLGAHKVAPALAVGNPIILRPATQAPLSSLLLAEIAQAADVPPGMLNVVACPSSLAEKMVSDSRVRMLSFTGSPKVGWHLKGLIPKKRVALELGGNAACLIEPDTDLDWAVPRVASGCFGYAGQICISVQRVLVNEQVYESVKERLVEVTNRIKTGDPHDADVVNGPLIDADAADRIMEWLEEAKRRGAKVLAGGERTGERIITPTLVEGVPHDVRLSCQEVFGPVATIEPYADFARGLAIANNSDYGINYGVFTHNLHKAWRAFEALEVGAVIINDYPTFRIDRMPYGGVKESGFGREGVQYTMEEMTEIKALILNLNQTAGGIDSSMGE